MNRKILTVIAIGVALSTACLHAQDGELGFGDLRGPYLGQEPPGDTPEIFAPGVISTRDHESLYAFMENGTVLIFDRWSSSEPDAEFVIFLTKLVGQEWMPPEKIRILEGPSEGEAPLVPSEDTLVLASPRSQDGNGRSPRGFNLWIVGYTPDHGFSRPRMFEHPLNSDQNEIYPSVTDDGTIYFFSNRGGDFDNEDIYRARQVDGEYPEVERLADSINTEHDEIDPLVAPDESYLIFCSETLGGLGDQDLFVAFRKADDSWTEPVNMGDKINSQRRDWMPYLTPDKRYLFFNSDRSGAADVYWVDAGVIQSLRRSISPR